MFQPNHTKSAEKSGLQKEPIQGYLKICEQKTKPAHPNKHQNFKKQINESKIYLI